MPHYIFLLLLLFLQIPALTMGCDKKTVPAEQSNDILIEDFSNGAEDIYESNLNFSSEEKSKAPHPDTTRVSSRQNPALVKAAKKIIDPSIVYDPAYVRIKYPMGDVDPGTGVCTDVVIRSYRGLGIDLQKEVHEDMKANFSIYPRNWGMSKPDPNIDHRRVPNLMTFFSRKGKSLPITDNPADYKPGDIVCWDLGGGVLHIGIVLDNPSSILHNIGGGQIVEDCLFAWKIIGHYSY